MTTNGRLHIEDLRCAADGLQAALLARMDLAGPLDAFAKTAGADGALILRDFDTVWQEVVHSAAIDEAVQVYLSGKAPPDTRSWKVKLSPAKGFLADFDSFTPEQIARDAYYQEFLRGHGFGWHAVACLAEDGRGQTSLSLKRTRRRGHYERDDLDVLNEVLPVLRETASFAHALGLAEIAGEARGSAQGGRAYQLDDQLRCGSALNTLPGHGDSESVHFIDGKPRAARSEERAQFDAALLRACRRPFAYATLLLTAPNGIERAVVRLAPIVGSATSLFHNTHVIMVVTPIGQRLEPSDTLIPALIDMFRLTHGEARVAALVGCGWAPRDAADRLGIGEGTLRNQLKVGFAKMGINRQVHLAQLVSAVGRPAQWNTRPATGKLPVTASRAHEADAD